MASIEQRGNTFRIRITLKSGKAGERKYYNETYTPVATTKREQKKEVEKYAMELEEALKNPASVEGRKKPFMIFVEEWKDNYASDPENMTESLRDSYYDLLSRKVVKHIGHLRLCDIKKADIKKVFDNMKEEGLSLGSRKRVLSAIRSVFNYACDELGILESNPSKEFTLKKKKSDDDKAKVYNVFTEAQYTTFLNAVRKGFDIKKKATRRHLGQTVIDITSYQSHMSLNSQWVAFFNMAIFGGFRRGELLALTWDDIDFKKKTVHVHKSMAKKKNPEYTEGSNVCKELQYVKDSPKTDAGNRIVDMPDFVIRTLKEWYEAQVKIMNDLGTKWQGYREDFDKNFVFIDVTTGKMMDLGTPTHKMQTIIRMYNDAHPEKPLPEIRLHDLRHTHATDLIYKKVPVEKIAQRLGHKNIYVTLTVYAHYLQKDDDREVSQLFEQRRAAI